MPASRAPKLRTRTSSAFCPARGGVFGGVLVPLFQFFAFVIRQSSRIVSLLLYFPFPILSSPGSLLPFNKSAFTFLI